MTIQTYAEPLVQGRLAKVPGAPGIVGAEYLLIGRMLIVRATTLAPRYAGEVAALAGWPADGFEKTHLTDEIAVLTRVDA